MSKRYYLNNIIYGVLIFVFTSYSLYQTEYNYLFIPFLFLNAILFPFSKYNIESIVLKFTSQDFWNKGLFMETPAKSGGELLFHLFAFIFAIPLCIIVLLKKVG